MEKCLLQTEILFVLQFLEIVFYRKCYDANVNFINHFYRGVNVFFFIASHITYCITLQFCIYYTYMTYYKIVLPNYILHRSDDLKMQFPNRKIGLIFSTQWNYAIRYNVKLFFWQILEGWLTWQSSTLVFITPFMYSFSMVGDTPKLLPMHRISVRPSGCVTSTEPFRITDHESSYNKGTMTS